MKIVALGQQKGGVGKSAAAINLACQAVALGMKAGIIDLDADQGTTIKWSQRRGGKEWPLVRAADATNLNAIVAEMKAAGVEWLFLDLPGRTHPVAGAGMKLAHLILIPCRPLDVDIEASVDTITRAKRGGKPYAYLMNITPPALAQKRAKQIASTLIALGHPVAPTIITQRVVVPDAIADGSSAAEAQPSGESAAEFKELLKWIITQVEGRK